MSRRPCTAAILALALASVGAGPMTGPVTGRIVDAHGAPVGSAKVTFYSDPGGIVSKTRVMSRFVGQALTPAPKASTKTDAKGRFRLASPPPGGWLVVVRRGGRVIGTQLVARKAPQPMRIALGAGTRLSGIVVDDSGSTIDGVLVTVGAGYFDLPPVLSGPAGMFVCWVPDASASYVAVAGGSEFVPTRAMVSAGRTNRLVTGRGRRVTGDVRLHGRPVAGAAVRSNGYLIVRTTTDRDGHFVLEGVPAPGMGRPDRVFVTKGRDVGSAPIGKGPHPPALVITLAPAPPAPRATPAPTPTGPVLLVRVRGLPERERRGSPVTVRSLGPHPVSPLGRQFPIGADGLARVSGLVPGPYEVGITNIFEAAPLPVRVTLPHEGEVVLTLPRSQPITGRVVDRRGRPMSGVSVLAERILGRSAWGPRIDNRCATKSDRHGRFRLARIGPGRYRLTAGGIAPYPKGPPVMTRAGRHGIVLTVAHAVTIEGVVVDTGGTPIPGAEVRAMPTGPGGTPGHHAATDSKGRFVVQGIAPGRYTLRARSGRAHSADVVVRTGGAEVTLVVGGQPAFGR